MLSLRNEKAGPSPYVYDWVGNSPSPDFRYGSTSRHALVRTVPGCEYLGAHLVLGCYGSLMEVPLFRFLTGMQCGLLFSSLILLTGLPLLYGYYLTLLVADFCLLLTLHWFLPNRQRLLLLVYWLSPVIILASYGLGLNDLIPRYF